MGREGLAGQRTNRNEISMFTSPASSVGLVLCLSLRSVLLSQQPSLSDPLHSGSIASSHPFGLRGGNSYRPQSTDLPIQGFPTLPIFPLLSSPNF